MATIAEIDGLAVPAVVAPPLDTYTGAAAAYSVRLLRTAYKTGGGTIMRVRRASDNVEADVGFDSNNELGLTSPISNTSNAQSYTDFADFVGHTGTPTSAFLRNWYDQSGNAIDIGESTATNQPPIYTAGALITDNSKPAISFDGANHQLQTTGFGTGTNRFITHVANVTGGGIGYENVWIFLESISTWTTGDFLQYYTSDPSTGSILNSPVSARDISGSTAVNQQRLATFEALTATAEFYINGSSQGSGTSTITALEDELSIANFSGNFALMKFQEMIIWNSDQSSNRTGIETNINSEYLIYQPTDAPTSGLLATYTGAAAAYSVRQLSDKAVIAMRIRRDSDDEERNIGWDANGDLDTTAISDFCQTANGYVTRWWDQSTNGNHADQATDASQPQIYNGTAVTTLNTKPSVTFSGSTHMTFTTWSPGSAASAFWVAQNEAATSSWTLVGPNNNQWAPISTTTFRTRISGFYTWAWSVSASAQYLAALIRNSSSDGTFHYNGNTSSTTRNFTDTISINSLSNSANGLDGGIQEAVFWSADQSTNRTGIESDINTYFSIY